MKNLQQFFLILILTIIPSLNASAISRQAIDDVKSYLSSIHSIASDFTQINPDGSKVHGKFLLAKPYNFRCNYYAPYPLLIIGSKNYVSLYDYEMEQLSRIPTKDNLFTYLLAGDNNIEKYFNIIDAYEQDGKILLIVATKEDDRRAHIELTKTPRELSKIEIVDLNGDITSIIFKNNYQVAKFDPSLFIIRNPDIFGKPARLNQEQLERKYK